MQVTRKNLSDTKVQLTLVADEALLAKTKDETLKVFRKDMSVPGFRKGKVPLNLVEKKANTEAFQADFLDRAMNTLYVAALDQEKLRPVAQPKVQIKKIVPFTTLEMEVEVEVVGAVKLADYKKVKITRDAVKVTDKDIDEVIKQLQTRDAEKKDVTRVAKDGDQVIIDFKGVDAKTKEPIQGADAKEYPLMLGSNAFIPGFEPEIVGLKTGDEKTFIITFPKDYSVSALQNRKVEFTVTTKKVQELNEPKVDDAFAAKVGPFKTVDEMKADIKKQLEGEKQYQADRDFETKLLEEITKNSKVAVPKVLVDEEIDRLEADERQNLMYRGQTWQEHLKDEGVTEEEHREQKREQAERRVKAGLVLAEIAEVEKLDITSEEFEVRLQLLKGQYQDKQMQEELDKPENRRDIASRMLTEKTIQKLTEYANAAK
jgi:trigger factor